MKSEGIYLKISTLLVVERIVFEHKMKASYEIRDEIKCESVVDAISTFPGHRRWAIVRFRCPIEIFLSLRNVLRLADTGTVVRRCGLIELFAWQWIDLHLPAVSVQACC